MQSDLACGGTEALVHLEAIRKRLDELRLCVGSSRLSELEAVADNIETLLPSIHAAWTDPHILEHAGEGTGIETLEQRVCNLRRTIGKLIYLYSLRGETHALTDIERIQDLEGIALGEALAIYLIDEIIHKVHKLSEDPQLGSQSEKTIQSVRDQLLMARADLSDASQTFLLSLSGLEACYENIIQAKNHLRRWEMTLQTRRTVRTRWLNRVLSDPNQAEGGSVYVLVAAVCKLMEYTERRNYWNLTHIEQRRSDDKAISWVVDLSMGLVQILADLKEAVGN
jgi:hypothetical protein